MYKVLSTLNVESLEDKKIEHFPPQVTAKDRKIVMPSPDFLYSYCVYNLEKGSIQITVNPNLPSYWSIAFYGDNTDNFYSINDRQLRKDDVNFPLSLNIEAPSSSNTNIDPEKVVKSPSNRGLILMRLLAVNSDQQRELLESARKTLRCEYLNK
jgi:uncharacterized membrane protein